jgi:pimeloyl-ACP methyl ester carboxylesterase
MKTTSLLCACLGLALSACGTENDRTPPPPASDGSTSPAPADGSADTGSAAATGEPAESAAAEPIAELPGPEPVRWRPCGNLADRNISCAEVYVPLDHADPEGEQIAISLNRVTTSRAYRRRGVLLYNPGGPGISGKASILDPAQLAGLDEIAPGYDFVGFDPRGIAASGDRGCTPFSLEQLPYPTGAATTSALPFLAEALAESPRCTDSWGTLFNKLGSNQVVHDMDWIRQALGEPKLNFLGASYGTRLGALYAHYFPETTGAIVLDAAVPPDVDLMQKTREVFAEQVRLTEYLLSLCEAGFGNCPTDARAVFDGMVSTAAEYGLLPNVMNEWVGALGVGALGALADFLAAVKASPDPSWLQGFVSPAGQETGLMSLATINCIDATIEPPTIEQVEALYTELQQTSPGLASAAIVNAVLCAAWPVTRDPVPLPSAPDAPPILVVGGAMDWRTPLQQAEAMTEAIGESARLLVSGHIGHGAFLLGSECTKRAMRNFILDGALPFRGTFCDANALGPELAPPGQLERSYFANRPALLARPE